MRPRRGKAAGWLLVALSLVTMSMQAGCQKAGGSKQAEEAPPGTSPAPTTPPPSTPSPTTPGPDGDTPPPVVGIGLTAAAASLTADGTSSTTITATLITSTGTPAADGVVVTFTTDKGRFTTEGAKTITATTSQGTGVVVVPFISEPGVGGIATIVATAENIPQSITIELVAVGPPPSTPAPTVSGIVLTPGADALVANGTSSTTITAELITSTSEPAPDGVTVNFLTDKGRFTIDGSKTASATTTQGSGAVLVPFISEEDVIGTATIIASVGGIAQSVQIALTGPGAPARIILTADATTIAIFETTIVTAQVLDQEGNNVADGTAVSFTTNLPGTGITSNSTTVEGLATANFAAGTQSGVATVMARANGVSATLSITIQPGPAGSLEFVSVTETVIGVIGSALPQKSTITFRVRDVNGNPVGDGTVVTFTLVSGVGGGETIAPTQAGTTVGLASTVLTSGTVSGPVRVQASVVGTTTLTSSSTNVSIAGGTPSGAHFGVFPQFRNIAGLVTQGIICGVEGSVGDRFGNPVPPGTAVSFFTNGGIISPQGLTDGLGNAPAAGGEAGGGLKTANPIPHVGTATNSADPRTGMVTILAVTQGEETFIDSNGNGMFDGPQEFDPSDPELDTPEPFIDQVTLCNSTAFPAPCPPNPLNPPTLTGNNQFDPTNRFELFIDANGNGLWDLANDVWDADKPIFAMARVLFSGPTVLEVGRQQNDGSCLTPRLDPVNGNPGGFVSPNGGAADRGPFCIIVSDPAGHPLVSGTTISITTTSGAISGTSTRLILPDTLVSGPGSTFFVFTVADDDPADTDPPQDALVTVSVVSPPSSTCPGGNGNLAVSFAGTVD